jgi:hypothetical protein
VTYFSAKIPLGEKNGRVEVDNFGFGSIWLEAVEVSDQDHPKSRNAVVSLTPKQARKIAKALRKAASA